MRSLTFLLLLAPTYGSITHRLTARYNSNSKNELFSGELSAGRRRLADDAVHADDYYAAGDDAAAKDEAQAANGKPSCNDAFSIDIYRISTHLIPKYVIVFDLWLT